MKAVRLRRSFNVLAAVDAVREAHPVLARPLTITTLRRVLAEECVPVVRLPIEAYSYVEGGLGSFVIVLRSGISPRHERRVLGHEYAHIKLHYTDAGVVYQHRQCQHGEPSEIEAQLFVRLLELGADATPEHPEIAKYVAALDGGNFVRRTPAQMDLPLPLGVPMYKSPAGPAFDGTGSFNNRPNEPRRTYYGRKIKVGDSHDSLLFDWSREGKPLRYFHLQLGWLDVWDTMPSTKPRRSREILVCGDRRATWRDFIISTTDRRRYEFTEREKRDRSPKALDRQLGKALVVRPITDKSGISAANRAKH